RMAATLGELGQPEAAIAYSRKGLALKETMAALTPANMPIRASLADAYSDTADLLRRIGRKAEALELYRRALGLADSTTGGYRKDLRHYHYRIGELLAQSGDFKGGLDHFRRSIALCQEWAAREPANVEAQLSPTFAYARLGEVYAALAADEKRLAAQRLADWREARAWQRRRQAILLDLRERGLLPAKHQPGLEEIAREIARCDAAIAGLNGVSLSPAKP
ncbi:MAG: tetratricopeptide repeat protein, partial [Acidobacteria bacterium]|nr:tetratricopeptide repeat protein [Acidobacteriota bacterium]